MDKELLSIFQGTNTKSTKLTKKEILTDLQAFSEYSQNRSFTTRAYDKWSKRRITSGAISDIFGSWTEAMQEAGLKPSRVGRKNPKELVKTFQDCCIEHKSIPTRKQFSAYLKRINSPYTTKSYDHYFGSFKRLAKRIADYHQGEISETQLLEQHSSNQKRKPIPDKLRYKILRRDEFRCVLCGNSSQTNKNVKLEVDHIIPVAKGGDNSDENLRTLCNQCNQGKKDTIE